MGRSKKNKDTEIIEEVVVDEVIEEVVEEVAEVEEPDEEVVEVEEVAEVIEEPDEEVVEVEEVAVQAIATPDYTYDAWWNEVGTLLKKKGYSLPGVVNRAKQAFGSELNEDRFQAYRVANDCGNDIQKNVEAVWNSQK